MKEQWLHKRGNDLLIVFFNGWGMDQVPMSCLQSENYDVLSFHDYDVLELPENYTAILNTYKKAGIISWSMGVWAAAKLLGNEKENYDFRVAVNGTLCPIHDEFGIPVQIFHGTLKTFSFDVRKRFYRRMCSKKENLNFFLQNEPQRSLENQKNELHVLDKVANNDLLPVESFYKSAVIAKNDRIMLTENQRHFWNHYDKVKRVEVEGSHFIFTQYKKWDDLVCAGSEDY